jgi:hypothetical protein
VRPCLMAPAALVAAVACAAAAPAQHRWQVYGNARYGYSVCYPADLFRPQAEPDAHDGVLFDGPPGATLSVSGVPAAGTSMAEVMAAALRSLDGRVTYRAANPGWTVASGTRGPATFYTRLVQRGSVIAQYVLVYPTAQAGSFGPLVSRLNGCFRIG